jgi:hypothetical protein
MSLVSRFRTLIAGAALATACTAAAADVYTVDFFPELPQTHGLQQLLFVPGFVDPNFEGGTITNTRLVISFTTGTLDSGQPFNAADLTFLLAGNVPDSPAGFWLVTGADLGWSGQGTFNADISTADFNGTVEPGRWQWDLSGAFGDEEIEPYAGSFSDTSRVEFTYTPAPAVCVADINQSGDITVQDIFDFLSAYFAGCP